VVLGNLPMSGNRLVAVVGTLVVLSLFYWVMKKTWIGLALRGAAQNRVGVQTAGLNVRRIDAIAFGIGVAMAATAGALLAPTFLVHPENGVISTLKGFEIIVPPCCWEWWKSWARSTSPPPMSTCTALCC
jgi:branched-chain amino acid transport system permease protein